MESNPTNPPNQDRRIERVLSALRQEYVVVGKTRVRAWHGWLILGLAVGIVAAILLIANRSGNFQPSSAAGLSDQGQLDLSRSGSCRLLKNSPGNIRFLVVPNRNITQKEINNGTFAQLAKEVFFGKADAYYYPKNHDPAGPPLVKGAPGFFDMVPLNEFKDSVDFYYYNKATSLDCELANRVDDPPPTSCLDGATAIRDQCAQKAGKIEKVIVLDRVGWDFAFGVGDGAIWFDAHHVNQYFTPDGWLPVFETGRVAAHEFGHTLGFTHVNVTPLQTVIPPVSDAVAYSQSQAYVPPNCDTFASTKWCGGANLEIQCLKDFQIFLDDVRQQCGAKPTLECEKNVWEEDFVKFGHAPLDKSCNIGLSCTAGGSYMNNCGPSAFLTSSGDSVMGSDFFSFNPYESNLVREFFNGLK